MSGNDKHYVYAHSNEVHGVFYVGKGSGKRMLVTGNRSIEWKRIVKEHGFKAFVLCECNSAEEAFQMEKRFIRLYREHGQCALNVANGGRGIDVDKRWWGDKISKSLTGKTRPSGIESPQYKDFASREDLLRWYTQEKLSIVTIAKLNNVSTTTVWDRLKQLGIPIRDITARGKAIVCTTDGNVFESITVAAKFYGLHRENIRKVLAGKYKTTGNKHFSYKEGQ